LLRLVEDDTAALRSFQTGSEKCVVASCSSSSFVLGSAGNFEDEDEDETRTELSDMF
jgi:hypothetical protein